MEAPTWPFTMTLSPIPEPGYKAVNAAAQAELDAREVAAGLVVMGKTLRYVRKLTWKQTQTETAEWLGICRSTVQAMERGEGRVSIQEWMVAWQAMGILTDVEHGYAASDLVETAMGQHIANRPRRHPAFK